MYLHFDFHSYLMRLVRSITQGVSETEARKKEKKKQSSFNYYQIENWFAFVISKYIKIYI